MINGDRAQLKQLFLNIFLNAIQSMETPEGGDLRIEAGLNDNNRILIAVSDTGAGIDEDKLDKIFDPFYTTKKAGTGLGLSICYGIVESHKGEIEIKSQRGKGTTVLIQLPLDL